MIQSAATKSRCRTHQTSSPCWEGHGPLSIHISSKTSHHNRPVPHLAPNNNETSAHLMPIISTLHVSHKGCLHLLANCCPLHKHIRIATKTYENRKNNEAAKKPLPSDLLRVSLTAWNVSVRVHVVHHHIRTSEYRCVAYHRQSTLRFILAPSSENEGKQNQISTLKRMHNPSNQKTPSARVPTS